MATALITGIRTVSIPVENIDDALRFSVDTLGFTKVSDTPIPNGRFVEPAPGDPSVLLTLEPAPPDVTRGAIGMRFLTDAAEATHATMRAAGIDADDILRWPQAPPMFAFRDPDGNTFSITEDL